MDLQDPLGEDTEGQTGRRRSRKQSHPVREWDPSPIARSNSMSKGVSRYPNPNPNASRRGTRMGSTTSQPGRANTKGEKIKAAEIVYYTERLKGYYDRSDNDVTSTVASAQKRKYLDQLKGQLKIGEKEQQPTAVVPYDPDPTGIKRKLTPLGKEDLMNLIVNMAKKLEEAGKSAEIQRLLDTVSGTL